MLRAGSRSTLPLLLIALASCAGGAAEPLDGRPALATVDVVVTPANLLMSAGAKATFTASVTGTADTTVTWSIPEGAAAGSIDRSGVYVAPSSAGTYHVVATSTADPSRTGIATVTVAADPPSASVAAVMIAPTAIVLSAGARQTFTCTVSGVADTTCAFAVQEGGAGGVIDGSGQYTAPQATGTYHVVATSRANPSKTASAAVVVTDQAAAPTMSVSVTPTSVAMSACQSVTLSASVSGSSNQAVTWSIQEGSAGGAISPQGVYTAPSAAGTYHAVATSQADGSKSASAAIVVSEKVVSVSVSPANVSVQTGQTVQFTATVTTTCGAFASSTTVKP